MLKKARKCYASLWTVGWHIIQITRNEHDGVVCRESSFGHGTLDVLNATHLLWRWHRNQDAIAQVADEHYIIREPDACENQNVVAPPAASVSVSTQSLNAG